MSPPFGYGEPTQPIAGGGGGGGGGAVDSVFGRTGSVSAQSGDYSDAQVTRTAVGVVGATVKAGLEYLLGLITGKADAARAITAGTGLTGGGTLAADRTLAADYYAATPAMSGTAATGSSAQLSRGDHVHPTDTTRAPVSYAITATTGVYSFVAGDAGSVLRRSTDATAVTYTVPDDATLILPVGAVLEVQQGAAGQVTIAAGAGVTLELVGGTVAKTIGQYATVQAVKTSANTWTVRGELAGA